MKLYCVFERLNHEGDYLDGIFSSFELAKKHADGIKRIMIDYVVIKEVDLDNPESIKDTNYNRIIDDDI